MLGYRATPVLLNGRVELWVEAEAVTRWGDWEAIVRQPVLHAWYGLPAPGFGSGHCGPGPLDTALSILVDALGETALWFDFDGPVRCRGQPGGDLPEHSPGLPLDALLAGLGEGAVASRALVHCQAFEQDVIARLPLTEEWWLPLDDVVGWVERQERHPSVGSGGDLVAADRAMPSAAPIVAR